MRNSCAGGGAAVAQVGAAAPIRPTKAMAGTARPECAGGEGVKGSDTVVGSVRGRGAGSAGHEVVVEARQEAAEARGVVGQLQRTGGETLVRHRRQPDEG